METPPPRCGFFTRIRRLRTLRTGYSHRVGVSFLTFVLLAISFAIFRQLLVLLPRDSNFASLPIPSAMESVGHSPELEARASKDVTPHGIKDLVTSPVHPRIVIYNRVPKCASATMLRICLRMASKKKFTFNNMRDVGKYHRSRYDQLRLADWIFEKPSSKLHFFFQHMPYLNFSRLGHWEPTWINVVRHPVSRFISFYYFKKPLQSLDDCIKNGNCRFRSKNDSILPQYSFFCGYGFPCEEEGSTAAMQLAKQTVESRFVVVGLQEELRSTLFLLEALLPDFFAGVSKIAYEDWNVQTSKPEISNETLKAMERKLKVDIEFYDYLKQRFFVQVEAVIKQNKTTRRRYNRH